MGVKKFMEKFSKEKLDELIDLVLHYKPKPPTIIMPRWWLEGEAAEHPERFHASNDGLTWCGCIVYSYGDRYESD